MKVLKKNLNRLYFFGDLAALFLASALALFWRYGLDYSQIELDRYLSVLAWTSTAIVFLMYSYKLYGRDFKFYLPQIPVIAKSVFYSLLLFFLFTFFDRSTSYSRLVILYFAGNAFLLMILFRRMVFNYILVLYTKGIGVKRIIGIGSDEKAQEILTYFLDHPELGYQVTGILTSWTVSDEGLDRRLQVLGDSEDFLTIIPQLDVQTILLSSRDKKQTKEIISYCESRDYQILLVPEVMDLMIAPVAVNMVSAVPLISFKDSPLRGDQGKIKRLLDIVGSISALLVLSPVFLLIALIIKLDDGGPVFFRQERLGKNGKKIMVWKFRTMVLHAEEILATLLRENAVLREEYTACLKLKDDPRITKCGYVLRKFSLDELPQLFNVLLGQMSLVGPRPYLEREFANELEDSAGFKHYILLVPPGITGLWQVSGRNETSPEERVKLDVYYINNWTFWLDIFLILKTIPTILARKGAY